MSALTPRINNLEASARNLIINGAFDFWQRGTSDTGTNANVNYLADRFYFERRGTGADIDFSRSTDVPSNIFKYSLSITANETNDIFYIGQRIEADNIRPYIGREMTFSCWVKGTFTGTDSHIILEMSTPTGGEDVWNQSNSYQDISVFENSSNIDMDSTWQKVSITGTIPVAAADGLQVTVRSSTGGVLDSGDTFFTTGWMLHEGDTAAENFFRAGRNLPDELLMCQRYYEKSFDPEDLPSAGGFNGSIQAAIGDNITSSAFQRVAVPYKATKRTTPTIALYDTAGASGSINRARANSTQAAGVTPSVGVTGSGLNGFSMGHNDNTDSRNGVIFHFTADAEL